MKPLIIATLFTLGITPHSAQAMAASLAPQEAPATVQAVPIIPTLTANYKPLTPLDKIKITYPGNAYAAGNCTWYAKSRRADIPNDLGNANTWAVQAAAEGLSVGNTPQVGAVAQTTGDSYFGHVAYVEAVYPDGTFLISEMNAEGLGVIDSRVTSTTEFPNFIY